MIRLVLGSVAILFVVIQFIPYGRNHDNPPVVAEPQWDSERTRSLAVRACYDCHSNETQWPWYSHISPVSWLVQRDVDAGRAVLNFSDWRRPQPEAGESAKEVVEGEMPPWFYVIGHGDASLNEIEKRDLIRGLEATLGTSESDE
ncbi:MAG: heme-binding domain-containing protein [Planctomycetaceae bacterium]|nr:heme-binding domain-containing protein [Planctomycetaceae bacterium]